VGRGRASASLTLALTLSGCAATVEEAPPPVSTIREISEAEAEALQAATMAPVIGAPKVLEGDCTSMLTPVDGPLSSPFGRRDGRPHEGIDLAVAEDTPVRAACDGVVTYAGSKLRGYGNLVIVRHAGELTTVYAHNHQLLVHEGDTVARGQVIARSGQTGRVTAPHLHFEVRKDSIARDPLGYLRGK
jgi:murein DD-endopeptidase MepM/ murein hydrolase activator NlpD